MSRRRDAALARVRKHCLALPDVNERLSHGAPTFFIRQEDVRDGAIEDAYVVVAPPALVRDVERTGADAG